MPRIEFTGELDFRGSIRRRFPNSVNRSLLSSEVIFRAGFANLASQAAVAAPRRTGHLSQHIYWGKVPRDGGVIRYHLTVQAFYASMTNNNSGWWNPLEQQLRQITYKAGGVALNTLVAHLSKEILDLFTGTLSPPFVITHRAVYR